MLHIPDIPDFAARPSRFDGRSAGEMLDAAMYMDRVQVRLKAHAGREITLKGFDAVRHAVPLPASLAVLPGCPCLMRSSFTSTSRGVSSTTVCWDTSHGASLPQTDLVSAAYAVAACGRFDDTVWFPLGRPVGTTSYPGTPCIPVTSLCVPVRVQSTLCGCSAHVVYPCHMYV